MSYKFYLTVINVTPIYFTLRTRAVAVTAMSSLMAPCYCDNLWCHGVGMFEVYTLNREEVSLYSDTSSLFNVYTSNSYICRVFDENARIDTLSHYSEAKCPSFRSRHFRMYFFNINLNILKNDRSLFPGIQLKMSKHMIQHVIIYRLGAVQAIV